MNRNRGVTFTEIRTVAGFIGFEGWGIYCATKFAINGLSEALAAEVKPFGIKVTIVQLGYFRTDFMGNDALCLPAKTIADYGAVRASQQFHQEQLHGNQPGDPEKAADVFIKLSNEENPPIRIFLGSDAYERAA